MIAYYGYRDGSGEYYVIIDASRCNGCLKCIDKCPSSILEMTTVMINLEEKQVVSVKEDKRKEIKYVCASCDHKDKKAFCSVSCEQGAITTVWNTD